VSTSPDPYEARTLPDEAYEPRPVRHPASPRELLAKILAPLAVLVGLAIKFGAFSLKFFGIFLSVGGYALIWGWAFAVGLVLMILVHELGHYVEAKRQGLNPALPVFIPFLGAYVAIKDAPFDPWRNAFVSIAGPVAGGVAALAALVAGEAMDSRFLIALGYTGFFLNLFNLVPIGVLDGGFLLRSWQVLRRGAGARTPELARTRAWLLGASYLALVGLLVLGMLAAHVPQDRL
jgi:Zn-dependent protease